jgi:hypothetical protein
VAPAEERQGQASRRFDQKHERLVGEDVTAVRVAIKIIPGVVEALEEVLKKRLEQVIAVARGEHGHGNELEGKHEDEPPEP